MDLWKETGLRFSVSASTIALMLVVVQATTDDSKRQSDHSATEVHYASSQVRTVPVGKLTKDLPLMIWWTDRLFVHSGNLVELHCPRATCYTTRDRLYLNEPRTQGFIFYGTDMEPDDLPFPRKPHHEWALFHEESPMNNYMLHHSALIRLFNHTATFRRESDYPLTSQSILTMDYLLKRRPVSTVNKNKLRQEGLGPVLYVQSHCAVSSDRDRYVEELAKHISVDSIGKCVNNKAIPPSLSDPVETMDSTQFFDLISQYKFHLAFENALCKDYMTEKLFRPLHVGSVPIYRGSPVARDWMPNAHSIIMTEDFESPEQLASFIRYLDGNDTAYDGFLQYKAPGGMTNSFLQEHMTAREWGTNEPGKLDMLTGFECHVCERLVERHQREQQHATDASIPLLARRWADTSHLSCPQPYPSVGDLEEIPYSDRWLDQSWIDDYWSGMDKAVAISEMVEAGETDSSKVDKYWQNVMNRHMINH